jgi:hypothetical protein
MPQGSQEADILVRGATVHFQVHWSFESNHQADNFVGTQQSVGVMNCNESGLLILIPTLQ